MTITRDKIIYWLVFLAVVVGSGYTAAILRAPFPEEDCEIVLSTTDDLLFPVSCTLILGGKKTALRIDTSGDMTIGRDGKVMLALYNNDSDDYRGSYAPSSSWGPSKALAPSTIAFEDVNFDGHPDLNVRIWTAAYQSGYDFYLYDPATDSFGPLPLLKGLGFDATEAQFIPEYRQITTYAKGRGVGDLYVANTYGFKDGAYILVERVSQDYIATTERYIYREEVLRNGRMLVTREEVLTREEIAAKSSGY